MNETSALVTIGNGSKVVAGPNANQVTIPVPAYGLVVAQGGGSESGVPARRPTPTATVKPTATPTPTPVATPANTCRNPNPNAYALGHSKADADFNPQGDSYSTPRPAPWRRWPFSFSNSNAG